MVFVIHRYLFRELLRVFVLATLALTVIMSLGSVLRPVQEYGVGPRQVIDLLCYFMPITLTFVLPVAALFATSFVYGRFAADNEFDACKASGISPAMLVYPGLILAIIVAIANLVLSFHVVPAYVHRAEKAIKSDARQILFRNIYRQGYYNLPGGDFRIYSDAADLKSNSLLGVVIMDTGKNQKLITAQAATVGFDSTKRSNEVKVLARNAFQFDERGGVFFKVISVLGEFESLMTDSIKFQNIEQMNAIKASPVNYYPVALCAWGAYERLTVEMLAEDIKNTINADKDNLYQLDNDEKLLRLTAKSCQLGPAGQIELADDVLLFEYDKNSSEITRSYRGQKLYIRLSAETETRPSTVLIVTFPNAVWLDRGIEYVKPRYTAQGIALPNSITAKLGENIVDTAREHQYIPKPSAQLTALIKELNRKIRVTLFEIKAEIHSRLVFGIGCITLILIGIGLGIRFRGGHLLTAFGISSIPAAALLVVIMMGKNITQNRFSELGANLGVGFMWAGLVVLTVFAFVLYRKLQKN